MKLPKFTNRSKNVKAGRQRVTPREESLSSPKLAYYSRRSDQDFSIGRGVKREKPQPMFATFKRLWLQRFGLIILLICLIFSAFYAIGLSPNAKIQLIDNGGGKMFLGSVDSYQTATDKLLASSVLNRNKITIDSDKISQELLSEFPELTAVSITFPVLAHRPTVNLVAARPSLVLITTNGESYVISSSGRALQAISPNNALTNGLKLPIITDLSGLKVAPSSQVLTSGDIDFINIVLAQLAAKHISVSQMKLPAAASELDVYISGQPYYVKFNLQNSDARIQVGTYLASWSELQSQGVTPAHYIDARLEGRAYYQ